MKIAIWSCLGLVIALLMSTSFAWGSGTPKPAITSAMVAKLCVPPNTDEVLGRWYSSAGYLLCEVHDAHTGAMELLKQSPSGSWNRVSRAGGALGLQDLIGLGVPSAVAKTLLNGFENQ